MMLRSVILILWIGVLELLILIDQCESTHVTGTFNTNEFFRFLIKFGFQQTDRHRQRESYGYIFGNVTSQSNLSSSKLITFAVLDRNHFLEYYGNRTLEDKNTACSRMFNTLNQSSYDSQCNVNGEDFLRRIPCPKGQLCPDEDLPSNVIKNNQFTYVIQDLGQPRFWYISIVSCYRNIKTCKWEWFNESINIDYDVWLVNGNPNNSGFNSLTYQFSYDRQNTIELYLLFFLSYIILVPLQLYAVRLQRHPVTRLFTVSLLLEFIAICLILIHVLKFAFDGIGYEKLEVAGDIFDILSRATFMLLLLLLAKGWAVTRIELTWKPLVFLIWFCYGVVHILLYVWNMTEVDIIEDIDEYQTWPGWFILLFRSAIMIWFLLELRNTMTYEHNTQKLNFLLHFGASALVWFIYLPIVALIALQISTLWRFKFLLGITYSADCYAYCVMTHLLWPTRSEQYFLLAQGADNGDELDEFNEAPHVLNNYVEPSDLTKIIA
ncbi:GSCOCG00009385001-RA-CDS [Cotesia congregata]|uniref:Similar to gpr180: Integral membrane protein GPR180 (Xenopus laevis) n=1 Tax=Cotesia congregata TaxID=51543 RepID=A0A8J2HKY2_COTCN|nr:GSCOCG00009385001-RA-CDS [Cotesia congregata]CAG5101358.1 Similar to gpr180: Integral membrane protein GPR180 (Xenopus laevis) [Cotesia congregata]